MTVGTTLRSWSATAANNSPKGTDVIGTSADDELRQIQATIRQYVASPSGTVVPSAGIADLTTATGHYVPVSGSSTITGLGSEDAGIEYVLNFTGSPILVHSTALQLPGQATITASTSDVCVAESLGSGNWRVWGYSRNDGAPARQSVLGVEQASTTGTSIDFTGIPSWVKRITVMFVGVSTNGTSVPLIQIGDSGGIESSGYNAVGSTLAGAATNSAQYTTGFGVAQGVTAAAVFHGSVILTLEDPSDNTWVAQGVLARSDANSLHNLAGSKALSSTLDRVRLTTVNGTDAFDAGVINVRWEE